MLITAKDPLWSQSLPLWIIGNSGRRQWRAHYISYKLDLRCTDWNKSPRTGAFIGPVVRVRYWHLLFLSFLLFCIGNYGHFSLFNEKRKTTKQKTLLADIDVICIFCIRICHFSMPSATKSYATIYIAYNIHATKMNKTSQPAIKPSWIHELEADNHFCFLVSAIWYVFIFIRSYNKWLYY